MRMVKFIGELNTIFASLDMPNTEIDPSTRPSESTGVFSKQSSRAAPQRPSRRCSIISVKPWRERKNCFWVKVPWATFGDSSAGPRKYPPLMIRVDSKVLRCHPVWLKSDESEEEGQG